MKLFAFLILLFVVSPIFSQEKKDYIIRLNKDTLFTKVIRMDRKMKSVVCEEGGRKIIYPAKGLLAVKTDTLFYESGLVRSKSLKFKHFVFLQRTIKGNLNLYEMDVKRTKFLMKTFSEDLVHFRWVYRAHKWTKAVLTTLYFYKKENEDREHFSKNWKEKTKDCKLLHQKYNSKTTPWTPTQREMVQFYNAKCN